MKKKIIELVENCNDLRKLELILHFIDKFTEDNRQYKK